MDTKKIEAAVAQIIEAVGEAKGIVKNLTVKNGMQESWRGRILDFLIKVIDKIVEFIGFILGLKFSPNLSNIISVYNINISPSQLFYKII